MLAIKEHGSQHEETPSRITAKTEPEIEEELKSLSVEFDAVSTGNHHELVHELKQPLGSDYHQTRESLSLIDLGSNGAVESRAYSTLVESIPSMIPLLIEFERLHSLHYSQVGGFFEQCLSGDPYVETSLFSYSTSELRSIHSKARASISQWQIDIMTSDFSFLCEEMDLLRRIRYFLDMIFRAALVILTMPQPGSPSFIGDFERLKNNLFTVLACLAQKINRLAGQTWHIETNIASPFWRNHYHEYAVMVPKRLCAYSFPPILYLPSISSSETLPELRDLLEPNLTSLLSTLRSQPRRALDPSLLYVL